MSENYTNESELRNSSNNSQIPQTIIIKQDEKASNGVGTAGFIVSLIAVFVGWVPFLGWIVWLVGLILSFVGIFKKPKGLAIAGLIISLIGIILLIFVFGAFLAAAATSK